MAPMNGFSVLANAAGSAGVPVICLLFNNTDKIVCDNQTYIPDHTHPPTYLKPLSEEVFWQCLVMCCEPQH
jgi:hypothetical protein